MKKESVFSSFIEKLRTNRKLEIFVYTALITVAAVIFLLSGGISCRERTNASAGNADAEPMISREDELERKLESILQRIDGVGRARVMLTYSSNDYDSDKARGAGTESLLKLSPDEDAKNTGAASEHISQIVGVIVVAEGARDISVKTRIESAVVTVLGTEPKRVSIFPMGDE